MKNLSAPNQTSNIIAASIGALIGLSALAYTLPHETLVALPFAATLIAILSFIKPRRTAATVLCGALGLACTRLTISLIQ